MTKKLINFRPVPKIKLDLDLAKGLSEDQILGTTMAIKAMESQGGFILADGTGAGKSRQILAVADYFRKQGDRVLIVAPAEVLKPNWTKGKYGGSFKEDAEAMGLDLPKLIKTEDKFDGYGISTYSRNSEIFPIIDSETILILDESHSLKNQTSLRSQVLNEAINNAKAVMFVSASPYDKPEEVFYLQRAGVFEGRTFDELMDFLGLKRIVKTLKRAPYESVFYKPQLGLTKEIVNDRIEKLFDRLAARGLFLRRELSLEGTSVTFREIEVPEEGLDQVDSIEGYYVVNKIEDKPLMLGHQRRLLENWKVEPAIERIKEHLDAGRKVLVYTSRISDSTAPAWPEPIKTGGTASYLRDKLNLGDAIVELHGNETVKGRREAIERFNNDPTCRGMIATTESGGVGLNLDDRFGSDPRAVIFITAPFGGIATLQAMGRAWRLTTMSDLIIEFLFCYHEVDYWNRLIIESKLRQLAAQIKNPRLVEMFDGEGESRKIKAILDEKCPKRPKTWIKESTSLLDLLTWSNPRTVYTKFGKKMILRAAQPNDEFWQQWRSNKETLKGKGISVVLNPKKQWIVNWWQST